MHLQRADVDRIVAESRQKRDGVRRDAGIGQEAHGSGAERMQLILGQGRRVAERLPDILHVQIGQITDDLFGRHAVGHEDSPRARPRLSAHGWSLAPPATLGCG